MKKLIITAGLCLALVSAIFSACDDSGGSSLILPSSGQTGGFLALTGRQYYVVSGMDFVVSSPVSDRVYVLSGADNTVICAEPEESDSHIGGCGSVTDANLAGASSAVVSPDGKHVYVTTPASDAVAWVTKTPRVNVLEYLGRHTSANIDGANGVAISPDGKHAYVIGYNADAIAWFSRDTKTGALTYIDRYTNALIDAPTSLAIVDYRGTSLVYVTSGGNDTVVSFTRNPDTGALTQEDSTAMAGVNGPSSIAASPFLVHDNPVCHLYVAAETSDSLGYFSTRTDAEVFGQAVYATDYDVNLAGASSVVLSPDGEYIFVAAPGVNGIASFYRDSWGYPTYVDTFFSDFITSVSSIAVTASGKYLFATSPTSSYLVMLRVL